MDIKIKAYNAPDLDESRSDLLIDDKAHKLYTEMPLFRGFRFSFNLASGKQLAEFPEDISPVSIKGAYKLNTEEFIAVGSYAEPTKKIRPSMVKLPPSLQPDPTDTRPTKSTSNLPNTTQPANILPKLRKTTPEVSPDPRGGKTNNRDSSEVRKLNKNDDKEQKKLEKKRQDEQKKQEKIEAQQRAAQLKIEKQLEKAESKEKARQQKLRKEKQKAETAKTNKQKTEPAKNNKQKTKKTPEAKPSANPLAQGPSNPPAANPLARKPYNTNTLDSSISKTSGPPPYNEITDANKTIVKNEREDTGNIIFGKPIDEGSTWDMVARHKAQVSRTPAKSRVQLVDDDPSTGRKSLEV